MALELHKENQAGETPDFNLSDTFNRKIRQLENGDWSLPYSVCFVMKKMDNFDIK